MTQRMTEINVMPNRVAAIAINRMAIIVRLSHEKLKARCWMINISGTVNLIIRSREPIVTSLLSDTAKPTLPTMRSKSRARNAHRINPCLVGSGFVSQSMNGCEAAISMDTESFNRRRPASLFCSTGPRRLNFQNSRTAFYFRHYQLLARLPRECLPVVVIKVHPRNAIRSCAGLRRWMASSG